MLQCISAGAVAQPVDQDSILSVSVPLSFSRTFRAADAGSVSVRRSGCLDLFSRHFRTKLGPTRQGRTSIVSHTLPVT
jgi:hypothetical protein